MRAFAIAALLIGTVIAAALSEQTRFSETPALHAGATGALHSVLLTNGQVYYGTLGRIDAHAQVPSPRRDHRSLAWHSDRSQPRSFDGGSTNGLTLSDSTREAVWVSRPEGRAGAIASVPMGACSVPLPL